MMSRKSPLASRIAEMSLERTSEAMDNIMETFLELAEARGETENRR